MSFTLSTLVDEAICYPTISRTLAARHDSSPCVDRGQNIIVLCDQGGIRMDLSTDTASTLRANATGHPPVVCVQYCGDKTDPSCDEHKAYCIPKNPFSDRQQAVCIPLTNRGIVCEGGVWETVRAESHGALPLVCFTQNQREEVRDLGGATGSLTAESGMHNTNYVVYPGVGITNPRNGNNPKPGGPCPTLTNDSRYYLVGENEGGYGHA